MKSRILIILILLLFVLVLSGCSKNTVNVTIVNDSEQEISELHIELFGNKQLLKEILPNTKTKFAFRNVSDSHYIIKGELKDGTAFEGKYGYVTNGMDFNDTFIIHKDGEIEFKAEPG